MNIDIFIKLLSSTYENKKLFRQQSSHPPLRSNHRTLRGGISTEEQWEVKWTSRTEACTDRTILIPIIDYDTIIKNLTKSLVFNAEQFALNFVFLIRKYAI